MADGERQEDDPFVVLFKIGAREHMTQLLHEGHLFLNPLGFFRKLENDPRADRDEATGYYKQMDGGTIAIQDSGEWQLIGTLAGGLGFQDRGLMASNVYCLHARRASQCQQPWRLDTLDFGDTFILFFNAGEFLRRVKRAVAERGLDLEWGPVEYVGRTSHDGIMGPFRKFSEHSQESEFRIIVRKGVGGPLSLDLGDLTDIAITGPTNRRLKLIPGTQ